MTEYATTTTEKSEAAPARRAVGIDVGSRNLSICCIGDPGGVRLWRLVDVHEAFSEKTKKALPAKPTIAQQTEAMVYALETLLSELQDFAPTRILLEQQPCGHRATTSNVPMKCLEHVIQAWFHLRFPGVPVDHVAARTKLGKDAPKTYAERKKMAVSVVREYLLEKEGWGNKWLQLLGESKKADDLADSLLVGLRYLQAAAAAPSAGAKKRKAVASEPAVAV